MRKIDTDLNTVATHFPVLLIMAMGSIKNMQQYSLLL